MWNRKTVLIACVAILGVVMTVSAHAWVSPARTTYLTFSGPIGLPGVTLGSGTYVFELADAHADLVRVLSRDRKQVFFAGFTQQIGRPSGMPADLRISMGEAPPGVAPPINTWYPSRDADGYHFIYRSR